MHRAGAGVYLENELLNVAVEEMLCVKTNGFIVFLYVWDYFLSLIFTHYWLLVASSDTTTKHLCHRNTASTGSCTTNT